MISYDNTSSTVLIPPTRQRLLSSAAISNNVAAVGNLISFRNVTPMDLPEVYNLEKASYPPDEAANRAKLQYRQHHAAPFFRCATLSTPEDSTISDTDAPIDVTASSTNDSTAVPIQIEESELQSVITTSPDIPSSEDHPKMVGYITATRCHTFNKESMSVHSSTGPILAIHSIVVAEPFRRKGYASAMLDNYIKTVQNMDLKHDILKIVLISKGNLLSFYVKNGFKVTKPSDIVHGGELWYECELELRRHDSREADKGCQYWVVDSFVKYPLSSSGSGNPAAVVLVNPSQIVSAIPNTMTSNSNTSSTDHGLDIESRSPSVVAFDPNSEENVEWMKIVAKEFNLSETAFIWENLPPITPTICSLDVSTTLENQRSNLLIPSYDGSTIYEIRFYTRNGSSVELCGHATLAAAFIILQTMASCGKKRDEIILSFRTNNGTIIRVKPSHSSTFTSPSPFAKGGAKVSMDFPWKFLKDWNSEIERLSAVEMIRNAFFPNIDISIVEQEHIIFIGLEDNGDDLLVELNYKSFMSLPRNAQDINMTPFTLWDGYNRGIIVCCCAEPLPSDEETSSYTASSMSISPLIPIDFYSRFFAPKIGIAEDSVTGSAHSILGPYYGSQLDKRNVTGLQMSDRGGIVECLLKKSGDNDNTVKKTVVLSGTAIATMSGTLFI